MYQQPYPGQGPFGPPPGAYGMPAAGPGPGGYRFSEIDREVFRGLAANLNFVSILGIVFGLFGTLGSAVNLVSLGVRGLSGVVGTVGLLIQGFTLRAAHDHFRRVAQDAGDDVPSTMQGVAGLRPYYTVMFVVTLLQIAATLAALAV